jgi:hypothetical protein
MSHKSFLSAFGIANISENHEIVAKLFDFLQAKNYQTKTSTKTELDEKFEAFLERRMNNVDLYKRGMKIEDRLNWIELFIETDLQEVCGFEGTRRCLI